MKPLSFTLRRRPKLLIPPARQLSNKSTALEMTTFLACLRRLLHRILPGQVLQCCGLEVPQAAENHSPPLMTASGLASFAPRTPPITCGLTTATTSPPSSRGSTPNPSNNLMNLSGSSVNSLTPLLPSQMSPSWKSLTLSTQSDSGSDVSGFSYHLLINESTSDSSDFDLDF